MSWWRLAERSGWRLTALVVALQQSTRYRGSLPCRHRRTVTPSLNWMRRGTPSQWILEWSRCVKPRSNFEFHWRPELLHLAHAEDDQWWLLTTRPARHCSNQDGMRRRPLQTQCQAKNPSNLTKPVNARWTCMRNVLVSFAVRWNDDTEKTWSLAVMVSSPSYSGGPLPTREAEPYWEPAQRSSVLSAFSSSLFAAIQWLTSDMQISSCPCVDTENISLTEYHLHMGEC